MRNILLFSLLVLSLNATEYFTTIQPYEKHIISSEVDGKVVFLDKTKEHSFLTKNTTILKLDTKDELIQVNSLKNSINLQKDIVAIKEKNYNNKVKVKQLSIYNKNQEKLYFLEAEQALENLQKELKQKQHLIDKKLFTLTNIYLDKILISNYEYITTGTKLFILYDFSKLKLEVFIKNKEIQTIKDKDIFINGKKSEFKVEKISQVRDEKRVSTYRVILSKLNHDKNIHFGEIVKVEFR